jgi:hypothetical protein
MPHPFEAFKSEEKVADFFCPLVPKFSFGNVDIWRLFLPETSAKVLFLAVCHRELVDGSCVS